MHQLLLIQLLLILNHQLQPTLYFLVNLLFEQSVGLLQTQQVRRHNLTLLQEFGSQMSLTLLFVQSSLGVFLEFLKSDSLRTLLLQNLLRHLVNCWSVGEVILLKHSVLLCILVYLEHFLLSLLIHLKSSLQSCLMLAHFRSLHTSIQSVEQLGFEVLLKLLLIFSENLVFLGFHFLSKHPLILNELMSGSLTV